MATFTSASRYALVLTLALLTVACASAPQRESSVLPDELQGGVLAEDQVENSDPWEGFNRKMYSFNEAMDKVLLKPIAKGYKLVMPRPVDIAITNFFENLADVRTAVNNLLQGKPKQALSDTGRVLVNSTIGIFGIFDIATLMKLEKHREDFGQTLAVWGFANGPYLVLPILGPSTLRDTAGLPVDYLVLDPVAYVTEDEVRYVLQGVRLIDKRADLLDTTDLIVQASLDPYTFQRDAYLQKREYDIKDGKEIHQDF